MKNTKTRSVGLASTPPRRPSTKAMTTLMLCAAALTLAACGQKRPLQLPEHAKRPAAVQPAASAASTPN